MVFANPLSASAATHTYKNSDIGVGVWANDTYGYSHANSVEAEGLISQVQVSNGVFTSTGEGLITQTYAQAQVWAKCRWITPPGVSWTQNLRCWDTY